MASQNTLSFHVEWANPFFPPRTNTLSKKKSGPDYRFLAIRERFNDLDRFTDPIGDTEGQQLLPELAEEDFPNLKKLHLETLGEKSYKIFSIVANVDWDEGKLTHWQRQRCGKSEEVHHVLKEELAGGDIPSKYFGACGS